MNDYVRDFLNENNFMVIGDDYIDLELYTQEQLKLIKRMLLQGYDYERISLILNPNYTVQQMKIIFYAVSHRISDVNMLKLFADPIFSSEQLSVIVTNLVMNMDIDLISLIANPMLNPYQMKSLANILFLYPHYVEDVHDILVTSKYSFEVDDKIEQLYNKISGKKYSLFR